jgi:hypothetical protein
MKSVPPRGSGWVVYSNSLWLAQALTEPSVDRGPRRGSPAGVVDAPDGRGYSSDNVRTPEHLFLKLLLGSGATALGSAN